MRQCSSVEKILIYIPIHIQYNQLTNRCRCGIDDIRFGLDRHTDLGNVRNGLGPKNISERYHSVAFRLLFELGNFENRRRFRVGNITEHYPAGRLSGIRPAEVDRTSRTGWQGHCAGQEDNDVIDVVRFGNVEQELGFADLLEVSLNLEESMEEKAQLQR